MGWTKVANSKFEARSTKFETNMLLNPNIEYLNSKQIQITEIQKPKFVVSNI